MITPMVCAQDTADDNQRFWKGGNKEIRLGYSIANLDRGVAFSGKLDGRFGLAFDIMRNIYLHRGAIGGFMKVGLQLGTQFNYVNFEKGHGSLTDLIGGSDDDSDDESFRLGSHQLVAGFGIGPSLTFMPFFKSSNSNLARLKFRAYFNVVPSYSAYITSDEEDDMTFHNAFACMFAGGLNIQWRKLNVGFQYKGGRATYKDLVEDIEYGMMGGNPFEQTGKKPRFASNFYTINIGLVF